jgi:hypothetical protein
MSKMPRKDYNGTKDVPASNETLKRVNTQNAPYSYQATGLDKSPDTYIKVDSDNLDNLALNTRVLKGNIKGVVKAINKPADTLVDATIEYIKGNDGALRAPVNAAFTSGAGTLTSGEYFYRVSALDANGESMASKETSLTIGLNEGVNVNWNKVPGATGYKVYGRTSGSEQLIATVGDVSTYLDNGSVTPSGALPTENTTGIPRKETLTKAEILASNTIFFAVEA